MGKKIKGWSQRVETASVFPSKPEERHTGNGRQKESQRTIMKEDEGRECFLQPRGRIQLGLKGRQRVSKTVSGQSRRHKKEANQRKDVQDKGRKKKEHEGRQFGDSCDK